MTIRVDWLLYGVLYCQIFVGDSKNPWNEKSVLYQLWSYNPEMSEQRKRYIHNYLHVDDFPWINPTQNLHEIVWANPRCIFKFHFFSRMRSKGSRFTLGVWGLRVCSLDVAFTVATVRNRSKPSARSPYGRAYGKFCRGGPFWRFQTCRCFVSRGRHGTSWHSDVFWNVSKVVLRGRCNTFATFSEDVLQFSWQAQATLDVSIVIFRGRRSTLDVSRCVFFANRIGRAALNGDKVQIPWQAWRFVTCAENWRLVA